MDYNFKVNLRGMIDILANHLYSSPSVFIRELLQNGTDAISARQKEEHDFREGKISIHVEEGLEIRFCDNGIGLTEEEIHKFLAIIGETSKKDISTGKIFEDYIGRFGIGLLSCFMVTEQIVVKTRSAKAPETALEWIGKPDGTYNIRDISDSQIPIGTQVILNARQNSYEYFERAEIARLVRYYGLPLPFPVVLVKSGVETTLNGIDFGSSHADVMRLGEQIFGEKFLDYIPLGSPTGKFSGVAYILPYEVAPHVKHSHRIYLKNMLLTEDGSMILPSWAFFVKCFFNTTALRPTASRENFYKDEDLEEAKKEITQCISRYFITLSDTNPDQMLSILKIHRDAIRAVCVTDEELYKIFIPHLFFETTLGFQTGHEIGTYHGTVYYTGDINRYKQLAPFFVSRMRLLVNAGYTHNQALLEKMRGVYKHLELEVVREGGMANFLADISAEEEEAAEFFLKSARFILARLKCEPGLKRFAPESLPVFYFMDETAKQAKEINDNLASEEMSHDIFSGMLGGFAQEFEEIENMPILYFNLDNRLVRLLVQLRDTKKIKALVEILYVQSLFTGHISVDGNTLDMLNDGISDLIEMMVEIRVQL